MNLCYTAASVARAVQEGRSWRKLLHVQSMAVAIVIPMGVLNSAEGVCDDAIMPAFEIVDEGPETIVPFDVPLALRPRPTFEQPPALVEGLESGLFVTTDHSWFCRIGAGLFSTTSVALSSCRLFSGPARLDLATGRRVAPEFVAQTHEDWKLSYEGVMGSVVSASSALGPVLISIAHGENKNEVIAGDYYQNTVNRGVKVEECASGVRATGYADCWAAYNGFVNLIMTTLSQDDPAARIEDTGPLLWPSMGYLSQDGVGKTSDGLRHPSPYLQGRDLYIFYVDTSHGDERGRQGGLEVARVHLGENSRPLVAEPYFDGAFSERGSLLEAFDRSQMRNFYASRGGPASELWPGSHSVLRFSVAELRGTPFFLGVEEDLRDSNWSIQLRLSRDLVHWGSPVPVPGEQRSDGWKNGTIHYPFLCNLAGTSQATVDAAGLYVLGAQSGGTVVKRRLRLVLLKDPQ